MVAQGVTDLGELAVDGELTATDETLAAAGSSAFYTVTTTQLGLIGGAATPEINLDVAVDVFENPFLTSRDEVLATASSNEGLEGDVEAGSFPAGAGKVIIRLTNAGALDLEESFNAALSVTLGAITLETEPNEDAGEPNDLGLLEDEILLGGALALGEESQTTIDFYIFEITGITDLSIALRPVGENPASGMRLSLFDDDDINEPLAVSESFIDFFSGEEVQPLIETVLEPGIFVVTVQTIDDTASGDYLMTLGLNDVLDCVPNATRCDENNSLEVCTDGFTLDITDCGEELCNQVGDFFGCGIVGEEEPNNGPDEANDLGEIAETQARIGEIILGDDEDWYTFSVADRAQITVRTESVQGNPMDTIITIFDADQVLIATNDDFEGFFSQVSATSDGPATFFVQVESFAANTGPYNVVFEAVVAECSEEDPQTCGDEGILGCDGFFIELVETCNFGCEEG
jgi:hypothetical protein